MINIKRLVYYHELIRIGSFTKAAKALNISQAFLSQEMARLEQETERKLVNRTTRHFAPTPFGIAFAKKIRGLIKEYNDIEQFIRSYEDSNDGALLVGVLPIFNRLHHYPMFSQFQRHFPNIEMSFIDGVSTDLLEKVRSGDLHLSYSTPFADYQDDPLFKHQVLYEDNLVAVMASNHPLASHQTLNLETLADTARLIVPQKGTGEHAIVSNAFLKQGLRPNYFRECSNIDIIMDLVMHQGGVVFLCTQVAHSLQGYDITIIPPEIPLPRIFAVSYLKRSEQIPMVKLFIDFINKNRKSLVSA